MEGSNPSVREDELDPVTSEPTSTRIEAGPAYSAARAAASAADATPLDLDACAKLLLMSEVEDLRDPKEALAFSRRANEQTKERDPVFLQTLAMAWFNTGDRARAIETQTRALARLSAESPDRPDVQAELARYKGAK